MKKTLFITALILSLATAKAEAHPWMCAAPVAGSMGGTILFTGGMAAFAVLPIAIVGLQDYHVWNYIAPVVSEDYPGDKHFPVMQKPTPISSKHANYSHGKVTSYSCDGAACM